MVVLLMAMTALCGYAQDSYREAVKEYLVASGQTRQVARALTQISQLLFKATDDVNLEELVGRYVDENLDKLAEITEQNTKARDITEGDLREVSALFSTPEGQTYIAHQAEWMTEMPKVYVEQMMGDNFLERLRSFEKSGTVENVPVNPEIDEEYIAKYMQTVDDEIFNESLNQYMSRIEEKDVNNVTSRAYWNWVKENMVTVMLNSSYGIITKDDLDYIIKLKSYESYRKTRKYMNINDDTSKELVVQMMSEYEEWMKAHGAQLNDQETIGKMVIEKLREMSGFKFFESN